ncbi:unnamed protein product [Rhizophagus irregularis]|nr:unnamed protein product [Rhizophagus irregularis]
MSNKDLSYIFSKTKGYLNSFKVIRVTCENRCNLRAIYKKECGDIFITIFSRAQQGTAGKLLEKLTAKISEGLTITERNSINFRANEPDCGVSVRIMY